MVVKGMWTNVSVTHGSWWDKLPALFAFSGKFGSYSMFCGVSSVTSLAVPAVFPWGGLRKSTVGAS